jgi:hypothetical protein
MLTSIFDDFDYFILYDKEFALVALNFSQQPLHSLNQFSAFGGWM